LLIILSFFFLQDLINVISLPLNSSLFIAGIYLEDELLSLSLNVNKWFFMKISNFNRKTVINLRDSQIKKRINVTVIIVEFIYRRGDDNL